MYKNREDALKHNHEYYKKNRLLLLEKKRKYYLENYEKATEIRRKAQKKLYKKRKKLGLTIRGTPKLSGWDLRRARQANWRKMKGSMTPEERSKQASRAWKIRFDRMTLQERKDIIAKLHAGKAKKNLLIKRAKEILGEGFFNELKSSN